MSVEHVVYGSSSDTANFRPQVISDRVVEFDVEEITPLRKRLQEQALAVAQSVRTII